MHEKVLLNIMTGTNKTKEYIRWEQLTRRWRFFAVIILIQILFKQNYIFMGHIGLSIK